VGESGLDADTSIEDVTSSVARLAAEMAPLQGDVVMKDWSLAGARFHP